MKKILCFLISILILISTVSCKEEETVNLYIVDGAPTLSVLKIISDKSLNGKEVKVNIVSSVDVLNSAIISGNADIIVMPVNNALKLYNNEVKIKLLTVNIFGCLYVVGKGENSTFYDFINSEINLVGKTGTPDISLKYLLNEKGIEYSESVKENAVTLKYIPNDTVISSLKANLIDYALIGEPLVSKAIAKVGGLKPLIDIKKEWEEITDGKIYTQAGVVVTDNLIESDLNLVKELYSKLSENKSFIYEKVDSLNAVVPSDSALSSMEFNSEILDRCSLDCKRASDIKSDIEFYLKAMGENYNEGFIYKGDI